MWYKRRQAPAPVAAALHVSGQIWQAGVWVRSHMVTPRRADLPTVGIMSPTVGGSGKTPLTRWVAAELTRVGHGAAVVSRGHGGTLTGPVRVDPTAHGAREVGDEPLWLASHLGDVPVIVSRDRPAGIASARDAGARVAVLDDALMNRSVALDAVIMVVGTAGWIGNGKCLPAGPLRMPLRMIPRPDILLVMHESPRRQDWRRTAVDLGRGAPVAIATPFPAVIVAPDGHARTPASARGIPVVAWAGIARPWRFMQVLRDMGVDIRAFLSFPDHHEYSRHDLDRLAEEADRLDALPLTTAKDRMRWPSDARWRPHFLEMGLNIDETDAVLCILIECLGTHG